MKPTFLYLNIYAACLPVLPFCVTSGFVGCANSVTVGGSGHDVGRAVGGTEHGEHVFYVVFVVFVLLCSILCLLCFSATSR